MPRKWRLTWLFSRMWANPKAETLSHADVTIAAWAMHLDDAIFAK